MKFKYTPTIAALFAAMLLASSAAFASPPVDDLSDAWERANQMIKFIEMGDLSSTELAGTKAIGSIEKALDGEKDSGKRDKLRDAITQIKESLSNAGRGSWPYAEAAAKRAVKLIEEVK